MNIFSIKRCLPLVMVCISVIACNQAEDSQSTLTTVSTAENPLPISSNTTASTSSTNIQDIWVLDGINDIVPDSSYFARGTPYFDFNLDKKTISGHTGCNGLNGKLKVKDSTIIVDSMEVAKEVCKDKGFEKKLLKAFNKGFRYNISNEKLYMNIEPGTVYVFRRIRRS